MSRYSVHVINKNFNPPKIEIDVLGAIGAEVTVVDATEIDVIIDECRSTDAILLSAAVPFDQHVIGKLERCKCIVRYGVGVDNVDTSAVKSSGIVLSNVPAYGQREVALHTVTLLLTLFRKLPKAQRSVSTGSWSLTQLKTIRDHRDTTIGIIGLGRIGRQVAEYVGGLGFKVIGYDPYVGPDSMEWLPRMQVAESVDGLLSQSNVVTLHVGVNNETECMVNRDFISKLPASSYLVNCSRGDLLDETAVLEALESGGLAGVGVDVLRSEPPDEEAKLLHHPGVIVTPHMGWYSEGAETRLRTQAAWEVRRILSGDSPHNQVA